MRVARIVVLGLIVFVVSPSAVCWAQLSQSRDIADSRLGGGLVLTHSEDPTQDFDSARQRFLELDATEAAARIRRGIQTMRATLAGVGDDSRQALQDSVTELESLARATEQRSVNSVKRLDEAFARAHYALANQHFLAALRAREQMAQFRVGEELRWSADHLQRSTQRMGLQLREDEAAIIDRTRTLSANIRAGIGVTTDEIGHGIHALGQSMANFRDRITLRTAASIDEPARR
jgi:hypothetical protein